MLRPHRQVVLAIRGTSSVADLVTDAVMHPEHIGEWLPSEFRSVRAQTMLILAETRVLRCAAALDMQPLHCNRDWHMLDCYRLTQLQTGADTAVTCFSSLTLRV